MSAHPLADEQVNEAVAALKACNGNATAAALSLGLNRSTFMHRIRLSKTAEAVGALNLPIGENQTLAVVSRHRLTSEINSLRETVRNLTRRLAEAEDHRASILGLSIDPPEPTVRPRPAKRSKHGSQAVVLHLSDLHVGEVVNREEV